MSNPPPSRTDASAPSWDDLLGSDAARAREAADTGVGRRDLREREAAHAAGRVPSRSRGGSSSGSFGFPDTEPPRKRRRWLAWIAVPVVLALLAGGAVGAAFMILPDWPD